MVVGLLPSFLPWAFACCIELAKVQSTEASNAIEGIRTTNTRLMQLCAEKTTPRNRDEEEIMDYKTHSAVQKKLVKIRNKYEQWFNGNDEEAAIKQS